MEYMENHPGGLAGPSSYTSHVTAVGDSLVGINTNSRDARDRRDCKLPCPLHMHSRYKLIWVNTTSCYASSTRR